MSEILMNNSGKVTDVEIVSEMKKSYLDYSMSVIVGRALPDVRDGLKPVHRRILYTMYENNLYPDKAYRKCADTVGAVLGRYHPHGDASVYDALVRMAQDFSLRYMMVDGQGNFGSIDGYPAAAYRYTEAKLSKPAMEMLRDIDKETVDFQSNYDDRLKEPLTLPSRIPSLLINGSQGIAVGMATNIPPHNLGEVVDAMCYLIDHPEAELADLCEYIKGPDFPTGGVIMGHAGIRAAYATGRGKVILRGKAEIEESHGNCFRIVISEIPYMVNKQNLIKSMMDLVKDKRIEGIDDIADYSSKEGMRIVIELKASANPQVVLNQLYSFTQLQNTFGVIMLALVNGAPKVLTLKEMLQHYIDYQCEIVERRTRYDLKKAKERAHILEALKTALDFIDEVIRLIRSSRTVADSKQALADRFGFDDEQTTAIVQMPLGRLSGLEKQKIEDELKELHAKIADLEDILGNAARILTIVKDEALVIRDRFVDDRRTEITAVSGEVDIEDLIPNEECVLTLTHLGYMKRLPTDTYRAQRRGGRGISGMTRREEDFAEHMFTCFAHDTVMLFTNLGRVYRIKAYEVPESTRTAKGMNIVNILPLQENEKVTVMLRVEHPDQPQYLNMLTRHGVIKRTTLAAFDNIRKGGIIAIDLDEGDELRWVRLTDGNQDLLVATKKGMAIRFHETDARLVGRTARGVKAITLSDEKGDEVVGLALVRENAMLMTVTETGYGRRSEFTDYRLQNRGGKGLTNYKTALYGDVAAVGDIDENQDIIMITSAGIVIRTAADSISTYARTAKGVRVMRLDEGDSLVNMTYAEKEAEEEESEDQANEGEGQDVPQAEE
ncbi:MAG: DNA gyrase subunit A [Clostridia bacterium]|nr:DNA gyrase subunit A [Clostridia bacterium]